MKNKQGLVQVYTGQGKGKTTAALGLALRAAGQGFKVCLIQFMKKGEYGEIRILKKIPQIMVKQFGGPQFIRKGKPKLSEIKSAQAGFKEAKKIIKSKKYDLVILDEINVAVKWDLIKLKDLINLIKSKPKGVELVLTGRYLHPRVLKLADLVSEIKKVKHYYEKGIRTRKGIEY